MGFQMIRVFIHSVASTLFMTGFVLGVVYIAQFELNAPDIRFGFVGSASAQELRGGGRGRGSGGTTNGTAGTAGAGASGTAAGSGAGAGGTGDSTGPGSVNQNRSGGVVVPEPPPIDPPPEVHSANVMRLLNDPKDDDQNRLPDRCADHRGGKLSANERLSGANLERLTAARIYLAPNYTPDKLKSGIYLMANYQEELEKIRPDATAAGTYLGLVTTAPVTQDRVAVVNAILCVTSSTRNIGQIQSNAETQRRAGLN